MDFDQLDNIHGSRTSYQVEYFEDEDGALKGKDGSQQHGGA